MASGQCLAARVIDWAALRAFAHEEIADLLQSSAEFTAATTQREQYYLAYMILHVQHRPVVPLSMIGRLFGVNKGTIRSGYRQHLKQLAHPRINGRPPLLTPEEHEDLVETIIHNYETSHALTMTEIVRHISDRYAKTIDPNAISHMLHREERLKTCHGIPMEDKRMQVTPKQIEEYFGRLQEALQGVPAHFVWNMDEMGHQEWADRQEKICYVPAYHPLPQVHLPVPRTGKRITLVACVAADGSYLKPLIVIPRKTYDADLASTGITDEKVTIYSQSKGYTDRPIFLSWLTEVFLPEVQRRREAFDYSGRTVLILDNCTAHMGPEVDELCAEHGVAFCPLPPHSSNQIQPLDLSTFGITKRHIARVNRMENVNIQSTHIAQVVSSFMSAASPLNVVGTFRRAGIRMRLDSDGRLVCIVSPEDARCLLEVIHPDREPVPTEEETEAEEIDLYIEHCAENVPSEIDAEIE